MTLLHKDFNFDISRAKIVFPSNNKYFKDIPVEVNSSEKDSNLVRIDEILREKLSQIIRKENFFLSIKFFV